MTQFERIVEQLCSKGLQVSYGSGYGDSSEDLGRRMEQAREVFLDIQHEVKQSVLSREAAELRATKSEHRQADSQDAS